MCAEFFDVVVVGGGHAACEAALASARTGASTLMLAINLDHIAQMSCNPAVGGIAKGHVVREIDALGGAMGRVTDAAALQFRLLNLGKGPAVWSPRAQCDKVCYQKAMKREIELQKNLQIPLLRRGPCHRNVPERENALRTSEHARWTGRGSAFRGTRLRSP